VDITKKILLWIGISLSIILILTILIVTSQKYYNNHKITELKHYEDSRQIPVQPSQQIQENNTINQTLNNYLINSLTLKSPITRPYLLVFLAYALAFVICYRNPIFAVLITFILAITLLIISVTRFRVDI
jgi:Flp pilus assembly protein TadB